MRTSRNFVALGVLMIAALGVAGAFLGPARAAADDPVSLLSILAEWKYPGSEHLGGAEMSDGGFAGVQSIKCKAVLTTPDPVEDVVAFYRAKCDPDAAPADRPVSSQSFSAQDDSEDRPVQVQVLVVNRLNYATTFVISRADGEPRTHIAWSHYRRLGTRD